MQQGGGAAPVLGGQDLLDYRDALAQQLIEGVGKKKKKKRKKRARVAAQDRFLQRIRESLTDEQKKKIAAVRKEFNPKFQANRKKQSEIITPEKRKAASEAVHETARSSASRCSLVSHPSVTAPLRSA